MTLPEPNVELIPATTSPRPFTTNTTIDSTMLAIATRKSAFCTRKYRRRLREKIAHRTTIRIVPAITVPVLPTSVFPQRVIVLEPDMSPTVRRNGPRP